MKLFRILKVLEEAEELGRTALNEVQRSLMVCIKVKVKVTLEQATKAQRVSRCIDLLFL